MNASSRNTLVIFVPAIQGALGSTKLRNYVKLEAENVLGWIKSSEERAFAGYSGVRFTVDDGSGPRSVDIAEVDWESGVAKLSTRPLLTRLTAGFYLLLKGIVINARVIGQSPGFWFSSLFGWLLIVAWLYLLLASIVRPAVKSLSGDGGPTTLTSPFSNILAAVHSATNAVLDPQGVLAVVAVIAYVAALLWVGLWSLMKIDSDAIADIVDVYERYLSGKAEFNTQLRLRAMLVQLVLDAIRATSAAGEYDRIVVLGHSLGSLHGAEAAAKSGLDVELITVGTFFAYLSAVNAAVIDEIFDEVLRSNVRSWDDFFSPDDYVGKTRGYHPATATYHPRSIRLPMASLLEKCTLQSHRYYFRSAEVLQTVFRAPVERAAVPAVKPL